MVNYSQAVPDTHDPPTVIQITIWVTFGSVATLLFLFAGDKGIEPLPKVLETFVLPLN